MDDDETQSGDSQKTENIDSTQTEANIDEDSYFLRKESNEFLEVIDGEKDFSNIDATSRSEDDENSSEDISESSGDDGLYNLVTPASSNMITTQVQRLSQLVQNIPNLSLLN